MDEQRRSIRCAIEKDNLGVGHESKKWSDIDRESGACSSDKGINALNCKGLSVETTIMQPLSFRKKTSRKNFYFACVAAHASCNFFCLSQSFLNFFALLFATSLPSASAVGRPSASQAENSVVLNISR